MKSLYLNRIILILLLLNSLLGISNAQEITLKSAKPVFIAGIIILPRMPETSMIITPVKTDQQTMDIAQGHANDAVVKGLTQYSRVYDADMNAKKAIRNNQMRTEYKGMLVSPENSVGVSCLLYTS